MWRSNAYLDESTCVALLDIHVAHALESWFKREDLDSKETTFEAADACAEDVRLKYPQAVRSRPYLRWILLKSAELGCRGLRGLADPWSALEKNCGEFPGLLVHRRGILSSFYIPRNSENPGWCLPEAPAHPNVPLHAVVTACEQLQDLATQVLAYRLLAWRSEGPFQLFQRLSLLQKERQGDSRGRLETLLSSYLACEGRASRKWLLTQLKDTEDWTGVLQLRDPLLYFARDTVQRAIERSLHGGHRAAETLRTQECRYYPWLADLLQRFIDEDAKQNPDSRQSRTMSGVYNQQQRAEAEARREQERRRIEAEARGESSHRGRSRSIKRLEEGRGVKFDEEKETQNHRINSRQSTRDFSTKSEQQSPVESPTRSRPNDVDVIWVDVLEDPRRGTYFPVLFLVLFLLAMASFFIFYFFFLHWSKQD